MPYWQWEAAAPLARWVAGLAASEDDGAPGPVRVLPDGGVDLLFSAPAASGAWTAEVFGPKTRALLVHDRARSQKLAVRLRPGAAARWLGIPAHALADAAAPLEAFWGGAARALAARLADAPSRAARRARLEATLLARAARLDAPPPLAAAAVARIHASAGRIGVRALARELGASERRLERAFLEHVGIGPKLLARIVRLWEARRALACGASQLEAALAAGYHDQAHLHRDSRALAGCAPSALVAVADSYKPERRTAD
jgi:methylphosphotriester-DNA--protein-cysteine methyltransferase